MCISVPAGLSMLLLGWGLVMAPTPTGAQSAPRAPPAPSAPAGGAPSPDSASRAAGLQVRQWASSCMACHGTDGRAEGTAFRIAGRPAAELAAALLDFKHDRRSATVMHQHARGYSDDELRRIAEYFARVRP